MTAQPVARSRSIAAFIPDLGLLIAEAMDEWKIPGLAIAVVRNGEVALLKAIAGLDVAGRHCGVRAERTSGPKPSALIETNRLLLIGARFEAQDRPSQLPDRVPPPAYYMRLTSA